MPCTEYLVMYNYTTGETRRGFKTDKSKGQESRRCWLSAYCISTAPVYCTVYRMSTYFARSTSGKEGEKGAFVTLRWETNWRLAEIALRTSGWMAGSKFP
jgi:hypothetical protein